MLKEEEKIMNILRTKLHIYKYCEPMHRAKLVKDWRFSQIRAEFQDSVFTGFRDCVKSIKIVFQSFCTSTGSATTK
jgi:hypothetical protein